MSRYALVVGIGQYRQLGALSKPRTDAEAMRDLLEERGNFDEVHLLLDDAATYDELLRLLEYVLLDQGGRAEVLLYFTGHGFMAGPSKRAQQGYLATYDCEVKFDAGKVAYAERALSFQELNALIAEATPARLAMLLDCCHSEFFVEQSLIGDGLSGFGDRGYFLSAACRSYEKAWANTNENHSVYTGALLQTLRDEQVQEITVSEAHNSIQRQLKGSGQEPIAFGYGDSLVLVTYQQRETVLTVSEECPYQGLRAFTPKTERFFKGREEETLLLRERLRQSNFVAVLGPSGSGKSSVVRAGLVTQLMAEGWRVMTMMPEDQPMANLKSAMKPLWEAMPVGEQRRLKETLRDEGILAMARQLPQDQKALLLVDQFEEVFTQCSEGREDERDEFIRGLVAVGEVETPLAVVMTMRSDFVNEWLKTRQPPEVMNHHAVYLGPLQGEKLRAAIEEPARMQGYRFGEGLSALLLADVKREENCLPLLEFALTELWEKRDVEKKALTAVAYEAMAGLKGALNKRAEEVYENLREVDKQWVKRICLQLVRVGRGDKDTRQRQPKEVLLNMGGVDKRRVIADVIADLVKGRLLVSDGDIVEEAAVSQNAYVDVAHEALLEGWERFAAWRQEDRDLLRLEQRLKDAYEDWQAKEAGEERDQYLLTGGLLAEVREQRAVMSERLSGSRPALMKYFEDSDEKEEANVAVLKAALAKAEVQEASRRIRDKLLFTPAQTVEATLTAIALVGDSQKEFGGQVIYPAQDALHRAWFQIRERLKIECHSSSVWALAFSPDGSRIVSGSSDNTIRLWDLQGNPIGKPFTGHNGLVWSVAFNSQGDRIISSSDDSTLRLWDLNGVQIGKPFTGHSGRVWSVAFSPDGNRIVSGGGDNTLRLWDLEGNEIGRPFVGHNDKVLSVACSLKGNLIISGSSDSTLRLWDYEGRPIGEPFIGHRGWVRSVAFNLESNRIVSGGGDGTLRLWGLDGKSIGEPFSGHGSGGSLIEAIGGVMSVAFSPQEDWIISSGADNTLRLWDFRGNPVGKPLAGHHLWVSSVAFSPQGDCIVSSGDNTLRLWELEKKSIVEPFAEHKGGVSSVAFSPEGDKVVSGSFDNTLRLWNLAGNSIGKPFVEHSDGVISIAISPKGDKIVSVGGDNTLCIWDLSGNLIDKLSVGSSGGISSVAFSPNGDKIVSSGSSDDVLRLWDLDSNPIGSSYFGPVHRISSLAFSPKGDRIISGGIDSSTLQQWNLQGELVGKPFVGHSDGVRAVAYSPDGEFIVSGGGDRTLRLWDLNGSQIGAPFFGHRSMVNSVAFSPKGDRIVSGSNDSMLRLWDLSGNPIGEPLSGHNYSVNSVAFSPRGDRIVSGGIDRTLRLWHVGTWQDELRHCCNMLMYHSSLNLPRTEAARQACEVCQQVWTQRQSAEFLIARGNALARRGEVDQAVAEYTRAKDLDPDLTIDPTARAQQLADWSQSPTA